MGKQRPNYERLWAPWRLEYVAQEADHRSAEAGVDPRSIQLLPGANPECFLCRAVAADEDRRHLVVYRRETTVVVLNRYPYNNGHLLVAPYQHKASLSDLDAREQQQSIEVLAEMIRRLEDCLRAEGFNVGLNLGSAAGAGVPGHLHWHIVPRWSGDTNFMATLAGARVIPQALDALWQLLADDDQDPPRS